MGEGGSHVGERLFHVWEAWSNVIRTDIDVERRGSHIEKANIHVREAYTHVEKILSDMKKRFSHIEKALTHIEKTNIHVREAYIHIEKAFPTSGRHGLASESFSLTIKRKSLPSGGFFSIL